VEAIVRARTGGRLLCALVLLACEQPSELRTSAEAAPQPNADLEPDAAHTQVEFACDESVRAAPDVLRRLTMTQYKNAVRDLTRWALHDAHAAEAAITQAGLDQVPVDRREAAPQDPHGSYRRLDQTLDQPHVDETFRVATALGAILSAPGSLGTVAGACATDDDASNDETCITEFIQRFGARALRRRIEADDQAFYRTVYGGDPTSDAAAYADVITVMLSSPQFLYFVEHGANEVADKPGTYQLSAYELASRLSFHFWQTLPDNELWQAAQDGSLMQPDVLAQQLERLMADARAQVTMAELFSDLLGLDDIRALDDHNQDPVFLAFAGADLPGPDLRQHVIDEALDMLTYYTWTEPAGVHEVFTSDLSFARGDDLARLYGVRPWNGSSAPPVLPAGERSGLLTRAWFLVSGSASTRPIQRGVFIRRKLLCDEVAPPPQSVNAGVPPPLATDKTTRQVVEALTEQPGTVCASCHASQINPLGFAFEELDALGRVQKKQRLFSNEGLELGSLPIDATSLPRVTPEDESVSHGPDDLNRLMLRTGKIEACLARNYFRFTFGRHEDLSTDGCALERLRARLVQSGRIRAMIEEAGLLSQMQQRSFEP
jgi:Protein of unknown function (DUF1588)/Protein of unknown function (DUF1592)/Protein of unknown function (DUF1595)